MREGEGRTSGTPVIASERHARLLFAMCAGDGIWRRRVSVIKRQGGWMTLEEGPREVSEKGFVRVILAQRTGRSVCENDEGGTGMACSPSLRLLAESIPSTLRRSCSNERGCHILIYSGSRVLAGSVSHLKSAT